MNRKAVVAVTALWILLLGVVVWAVANNHSTADTAVNEARVARQIASSVREAQIATCHAIGDPLLHGQIRLWQDKRDASADVHASDLPGFSKRRFHQLVSHNRRVAQRHIDTLRAAPSCEARFSPDTGNQPRNSGA